MVVPLSECSAETQEEVRLALLSDTPPPKWKVLGDPDDWRHLAAIPSRAWYEWHLARGRDMVESPSRPSLSAATRQAVIERDGLQCGLCGGGIDSVQGVDIDHIVPLSRGGGSDPGNLQVTHSSCNRSKGNRV